MAKSAGKGKRGYTEWTPAMFARMAILKGRGLKAPQVVKHMTARYPGIGPSTVRRYYYKRFPGPDYAADHERAVYYLSPEGRKERAERTAASNRKSHMEWTPKMLAELRDLRKKGRRASEVVAHMKGLYPDISPSTAGKFYQIFLESPNPDGTYRREVAKRTRNARSKNAKRGWAAHRKKARGKR